MVMSKDSADQRLVGAIGGWMIDLLREEANVSLIKDKALFMASHLESDPDRLHQLVMTCIRSLAQSDPMCVNCRRLRGTEHNEHNEHHPQQNTSPPPNIVAIASGPNPSTEDQSPNCSSQSHTPDSHNGISQSPALKCSPSEVRLSLRPVYSSTPFAPIVAKNCDVQQQPMAVDVNLDMSTSTVGSCSPSPKYIDEHKSIEIKNESIVSEEPKAKQAESSSPIVVQPIVVSSTGADMEHLKENKAVPGTPPVQSNAQMRQVKIDDEAVEVTYSPVRPKRRTVKRPAPLVNAVQKGNPAVHPKRTRLGVGQQKIGKSAQTNFTVSENQESIEPKSRKSKLSVPNSQEPLKTTQELKLKPQKGRKKKGQVEKTDQPKSEVESAGIKDDETSVNLHSVQVINQSQTTSASGLLLFEAFQMSEVQLNEKQEFVKSEIPDAFREYFAKAVMVADHFVYLAFGFDCGQSAPTKKLAIFDRFTGEYKWSPALNEPRELCGPIHFVPSKSDTGPSSIGALWIFGGMEFRRKKMVTSIERLQLDGTGFPQGGWQLMGHIPPNMTQINAAEILLGNKLYRLGGFDVHNQAMSIVRTYDLCSGEWCSLDHALPYHVHGHALAVDTEHILYVAGGYTKQGVTAQVFSVSLSRDNPSLHILPQMQVARGDLQLRYLDGVLYAFGGFDAAGNSLKSVEKYDFEKKQWSICEKMELSEGGEISVVFMQSNV